MYPIKPVLVPGQPADTVQTQPCAKPQPRLSAGWIIAWLVTVCIAYSFGYSRGQDHQSIEFLLRR